MMAVFVLRVEALEKEEDEEGKITGHRSQAAADCHTASWYE